MRKHLFTRTAGQRGLTFALAAAGTGLFWLLGLPLPFLFGPMTFCLAGALAHVPLRGFGQVSVAARTILGVAVGASITPAVIAEMRAATEAGDKHLRWFENDVTTADGSVIARVRKQLYVRRKPRRGG